MKEKFSIILKRKVSRGIVHVKATFNNTIISITNTKGEVVSWSSAGVCGFKGSRKSTAFAAQTAAEFASKSAIEQGMRQVEVIVTGPGNGRETAIRSIQSTGLNISLIRDITPVPHNGCRSPKKRRV
uniref:Small ribosomal subunit protein uS11c n=1 Tax=Eutreptiella sp. CCMP389 TaxID=96781 RepID=A0A977PK05_9EUGL|nr:ribosomal protein S11 [Eutreptiella sp. CCMP389]